MREKLSTYKFKKIAEEALRNGIRLHIDSMLLYYRERYPSALQLSIIAMEEIAKAKWVEHYYYSSITNDGFPDAEFEQGWLKLLYLHPKKQYTFLAREIFSYSPKFVKFVESNKLEELKQRATYVGLKKSKGKVDVNSRISIPLKTSANAARKIISLINDVLKEMCEINLKQEYYFDIEEMNYWIGTDLLDVLLAWNHKSGIKSEKWEKIWFKK